MAILAHVRTPETTIIVEGDELTGAVTSVKTRNASSHGVEVIMRGLAEARFTRDASSAEREEDITLLGLVSESLYLSLAPLRR